MEKITNQIALLLADYENNQMSASHILRWVSQFDETDREFILSELEVIFSKCYFSKSKCIDAIAGYIEYLTKHFKYESVASFLAEARFLSLQGQEKSQTELIGLLDEILRNKYRISVSSCGKSPKYYIYLDDVLATGNKVFFELSGWLKETSKEDKSKTNWEYVNSKSLNVLCCFLCLHSWGFINSEFRLIKEFDENIRKRIKWFQCYEIQNQLKGHNQKLNLMIPVEEGQPKEVLAYLNSLEEATSNADRAFRKPTQPSKEELFSSPENRERIENIFLKKGVELLKGVKKLNVKQLRPLGYTVKSHKTFGLGTLFFTYRNIPNNCPIVFWWGSNNWQPLFILKNRGKQ